MSLLVDVILPKFPSLTFKKYLMIMRLMENYLKGRKIAASRRQNGMNSTLSAKSAGSNVLAISSRSSMQRPMGLRSWCE